MRFLISTIRVFFIFTIISIGRIGHTESFFRIPVVDLDHRHDLQIVVDKEEGVYLGHPSTVLLEDGKTILIVYPKGHGKGRLFTNEAGMEEKLGPIGCLYQRIGLPVKKFRQFIE